MTDVSAAIARSPSDPALYLRRAQLHRERADHHSALADLDLAVTLPGGALPANQAAAETLLAMGQATAAIARLDRVLAVAPHDLPALRLKARAQLAAGQPAAAVATHRTLLASSSTREPDHYLEAAQAMAATGARGIDGYRGAGPRRGPSGSGGQPGATGAGARAESLALAGSAATIIAWWPPCPARTCG